MNPRFKYPRTPHLPWSPGSGADDDVQLTTDVFEGQEIVVTEKLDGENTSLYPDGLHARSIDGRHHPSRTWVKQLQGQVGHRLPQGSRVCGENLYARHSIAYEALESWFYVFSIWDAHNRCLPWDDTVAMARELELAVVPVLYRGPWHEPTLRALEVDTERSEGWVVRTVGGFRYEDFDQHVAKWVRAGHVQTDEHWMLRAVVPNGLRGS